MTWWDLKAICSKNGLLADDAGLVRLAASFAVLYANVFMPANVKIANDFCSRHSVYG